MEGSRSSNLLRHLHKGFLPAICSLPVPGYMVFQNIYLLKVCLILMLVTIFSLLVVLFFANSLAKPLFALMLQQRQQDMVLLLLTGQKGSWFWPLLH